jgi:hypothetical protein
MNVGLSSKHFEEAVIKEFGSMYDAERPIVVSEAEKEVLEIAQGLEELIVCDTAGKRFMTC